jgi:hypothetical protein
MKVTAFKNIRFLYETKRVSLEKLLACRIFVLQLDNKEDMKSLFSEKEIAML